MRDPAPVPIYLKDYAPPAFLIETVDLDIDLFEERARVRSRLAMSRNPKAARAFVEFLLTERGQKVFMERGLFPVTPKYKVQGPPGSTAELAVQFTGGIRSYFDGDIANVYDEAVASKRSEGLKTKFRSDIEATWKK